MGFATLKAATINISKQQCQKASNFIINALPSILEKNVYNLCQSTNRPLYDLIYDRMRSSTLLSSEIADTFIRNDVRQKLEPFFTVVQSTTIFQNACQNGNWQDQLFIFKSVKPDLERNLCAAFTGGSPDLKLSSLPPELAQEIQQTTNQPPAQVGARRIRNRRTRGNRRPRKTEKRRRRARK
jgi:hypothetical protein